MAGNPIPVGAGAGKYDDLCTYVRTEAEAKTVLVVILEGNKGSGFSVQGDINDVAGVPTLLENVAKGIRAAAQ